MLAAAPRSGRVASMPGKARFRLPGRRCSASPLSRAREAGAQTVACSRSRRPRRRAASSSISAAAIARGSAEPDAKRRRQGARAQARAPARRRRTAARAAPAAGAGHRARRRPSARRSCGRRSTSDRSSSPRHRAGSCRPPAPRRCGTARPARHSAPISASGCITPISLCAAMTETSRVRAADRRGEPVEIDEPVRLDRQARRSPRALAPHATLSSTHLCSVARVTIWSRPARRCGCAKRAPLIARLLASVAPEVKTISRGSASISAATSARAASIAASASRADRRGCRCAGCRIAR